MPILGAMSHHVVLLRGINVGGRHSLAMAEVREALGGAGFTDIATYIQSGNIVLGSRLEASRVADRVQGVLEELAGFPVPTVVLGAPEFREVLAGCPFRPAEPKLAHVVVLPRDLDDERRERLLALAAADDSSSELAVGSRVVYLSHPDGLSRSVLATRAMALLKDATARNLATMAALEAMVARV